MTDYEQLSMLYQDALRISYDDSSKFVFMSDCHRGDGSGADNFRDNQNIVITALRYYNKNKFTYFELGDGDELWANKDFGRISAVNVPIFEILAEFYSDQRYFSIFGNHDIVKGRKKWVAANLSTYTMHYNEKVLPLFPQITIPEAIVLTNRHTDNNILLVHGHQVDFINDNLWRLSRFLVRHLWRPLETLGIKDPTSTTNAPARKNMIQQTFADWSMGEDVMVIAGHTHRTVFPKPNEPMYFNDGCCVYPHFATAIEIENGTISLVKWSITTNDDGILSVVREILKGPTALAEYFQTPCTASTCMND